MASVAAPLEHQIDSIGAWLGYQLQGKQKEFIIAYTSGKDTFVALPLVLQKPYLWLFARGLWLHLRIGAWHSWVSAIGGAEAPPVFC